MTQSTFSSANAAALLNDLRRANTEQAKKERFLQYLTKTFSGDDNAQRLISALTMGAEQTVVNIPRYLPPQIPSKSGRRHSKAAHATGRGRADTLTETIIIEWEKDLAKTGSHAVEQLRDYLAGKWKSGSEYHYVLIATDGIRWRLYAPDWSHLKSKHFALTDEFQLRPVRFFELSDDTLDDFPFFLDEILFVSRPKIATLKGIQADFGSTSSTFINSMRTLQTCEPLLRRKSELRTAFDQWRKFLSIAYGKFDDSPGMFLVHTYLSVFAKLLAFAVLGTKHVTDETTIEDILTGVIFEQQFMVERFVENDFFYWVAGNEYVAQLRPMFRELNRRIAEYDFSDTNEDVLKGVYQELIDLETRHALGEYFTPDWLCERMMDALPLTRNSRILDPACGSGSFLRAAISQLRRKHGGLTAEELTTQICGIDIHPLSIQISKTTVLLALGKSIETAKRPVTLHIYLANSLLVPEQTADLFKSMFKISIDNKVCTLNTQGLISQERFDELITLCDDLAKRKDMLSRARFASLTDSSLPRDHVPNMPQQLYDIYRALKIARDEGRDSIWRFILQNSYKPVFLRELFDFVVGNPPWLTYADISNVEYQAEIRRLADDYHVTPPNKANMPHMEIAAIFLAHSVNYFLRPSGTMAFVLPRSFMSADQHDQTRSGAVLGVRLSEVWDLDGVQPLFRVPACVFFATPGGNKRKGVSIPASGIAGRVLAGQLPRAHLHWNEARPRLQEETTRWYYSKLLGGSKRSRSALTRTRNPALTGHSAYADRFKQGATIVPRSFYFVETAEQIESEGTVGRVFNVRSSNSMLRDAKPPWKGFTFSGRIEGSYLFCTAVAKNVLPFMLVKPLLITLPVVVIRHKDNTEEYQLAENDELLKRRARFATQWFSKAERLWNEHRTERSEKSEMSYLDRLNFQHGITEQSPTARYLVLYTSSATDASAAVVDRTKTELPFIAESKTYWCQTQTEAEAYYLCAFLNSEFANQQIKEFQSRGLFGPRDIHKTIVKLPFPRFDSKDSNHHVLAALGAKCTAVTRNLFRHREDMDLDARTLGRVRVKIREHLDEELSEIDPIVARLSSGKSDAAVRSSGRGRKRSRGTLRLFD